jgi:hypothetical protein
MRVSDDDLRELLAERPRSRQACPAADVLAGAAGGTLADAERDAVMGHVAGCRACGEEMRAVAPLQPWAEDAARRLRPGRPRWVSWPALAAAAAVLLALPLAIRPPRAAAPPALRAQDAPALRSMVPERAAVPRAACVLRWSDVGARYSVTVLSKDLRPLASARGLERPEYTVEAAALTPVASGGEIVWSVEARWPDGRRLASPTFVNRLE